MTTKDITLKKDEGGNFVIDWNVPTDAQEGDHEVTLNTPFGNDSVILNVLQELTIENFESGGLGPWSGSTGQYKVTQGSPIYEGNYSLKTNFNGNSYAIYSPEGNGLNYYPQSGDNIQFPFSHKYNSQYQTIRLMFGGNGATNLSDWSGYYFYIRTDGNIRLYKSNPDGSNSQLASSSNLSIPENTKHYGQIEWGGDGTITGKVLDKDKNVLDSLSAIDTEYADQRGVGIRNTISSSSTSDGGVVIDEVKTI